MTELPAPLMPTVAAIDCHYEKSQWIGWPWRLSPSTVSGECDRAAFYTFRWTQEPERVGGRIARLFETGHREESRMVRDLMNAGVAVADKDPATRKQWEYLGLGGHFRLKLDGIVTGIIESPKKPHVLECKTHNAKSFAQLAKHDLKTAKPEHWVQCQLNMHLSGIDRAFYLAKSKDDDSYYSQRVKYDYEASERLMARAERILNANEAPPKISENPDHFGCRFCKTRAVCHEGKQPLRNCRTCLHSEPDDTGGWFCRRHTRQLSIDDQRAGCPYHLYLPSLVPGEQIDSDETAETVTYRLPDGGEWVDGGDRQETGQ